MLTVCWTALLKGSHRGTNVVGIVTAIIVALTVNRLLFDAGGSIAVKGQTTITC